MNLCCWAAKKIKGRILVPELRRISCGESLEGSTESVADIDTSTHPNRSIVILNKEQTDVPGYVHTQYAFIDQLCGAQLVDHYGPPVDPNDKELRLVEQRACMEIAMNTHDGD